MSESTNAKEPSSTVVPAEKQPIIETKEPKETITSKTDDIIETPVVENPEPKEDNKPTETTIVSSEEDKNKTEQKKEKGIEEEKGKEEKKEEKKEEEKEENKEEKKEEKKEEELIENGGEISFKSSSLFGFNVKTKGQYVAFGDEPIPVEKLQSYYKINYKKVSGSITTTTKTITTIVDGKTTTATETVATVVKSDDEGESTTKALEKDEPEEKEEKKEKAEKAELIEEEKQVDNIETVETTVTSDKQDETKETEKKETEKKEAEKKESDKQDETKETSAKLLKKIELNKALHHNISHASVTGKGLLVYYKSQKEYESKEPLGIINLKDATIEKPSSGGNSFHIKTNIRDYTFNAHTTHEREKWVKSIEKKIEEAKSLESVDHHKEYKDTCQKLDSGTAYTDITSDDETQKTSVENKRKTFNFLFKSIPTTTTETTEATGTEDTSKSPTKTRSGFFSFGRKNTDVKEDTPTTNAEDSTAVTNTTADTTNESETVEKHDESENNKTHDATAAPNSIFSKITNAVTATVTSLTGTDETSAADKKEDEEEVKKEDETKKEEEEKPETEEKKGEHLVKKIINRSKTLLQRKKHETREAEASDVTATKNEEAKPDTDVPITDDDTKTDEKKDKAKETDESVAKDEESSLTPETPPASTSTSSPPTSDKKKSAFKNFIFSSQKTSTQSGTTTQADTTAKTTTTDDKPTSETTDVKESSTDVKEATTDVKEAGTDVKEADKDPETHLIEGEIEKEGFLVKESQFLKSPEKKYFILGKDGTLYYFNNRKEPTSKKKIEITKDVKIKEITEKHVFEIETKNRTYKLFADNDEDRSSWCKALNEVVSTRGAEVVKGDDVTLPKITKDSSNFTNEVTNEVSASNSNQTEKSTEEKGTVAETKPEEKTAVDTTKTGTDTTASS